MVFEGKFEITKMCRGIGRGQGVLESVLGLGDWLKGGLFLSWRLQVKVCSLVRDYLAPDLNLKP